MTEEKRSFSNNVLISDLWTFTVVRCMCVCVCASVLGLCVPAKKVNMAQSPDLVCGKVREREDDNVWLDIRYVNNQRERGRETGGCKWALGRL